MRQRPGLRRLRDEDRQLLARAERAGLHVGELARTIHGQEGEPAVRRVLGLLSLVKRHGALAVEQACVAALDLGAPTYR